MAKRQSYLKRKQTFSGAQVLLFVLVFAAVGAVAIWQSLAAPHSSGSKGGGKTGSGSLTLNLPPVLDNNSDGQPNFGDKVTFTVTDSATFPSVELDCFQNNGLVSMAIVGYYPTYPFSKEFTLASPSWTSGAANCTATLYHSNKNGSKTTDATLSFLVNA